MRGYFGKVACVMAFVLLLPACGIREMSVKKIKDIDYSVVTESELPAQVEQIVEERKRGHFQVTYTDNEYTYILIGYGKQKYRGYSIEVKQVYETKNAVCVETEFNGPKEYQKSETETYPYIVIRIKLTDKNVLFCDK